MKIPSIMELCKDLGVDPVKKDQGRRGLFGEKFIRLREATNKSGL
jgi:hypothetical protein